jgi:signal transduction histidine kinase
MKKGIKSEATTQHEKAVNLLLKKPVNVISENSEEEIIETEGSPKMLNTKFEEISDEESTFFSREIQDHIGQSLVALKIDLDWIREKTEADSEVGLKLQGSIELLTSVIKNVQRLCFEIHPLMLYEIALSQAMEYHIREFEKRTGIACNSKLDDVRFQSEKKNLELYLTLKEALTYIERHANANNVEINLFHEQNSIILEVIDNGWGIEKEKTNSDNSPAFVGMRDRMKKYDGCVEITPSFKNGTNLRVSVPVN